MLKLSPSNLDRYSRCPGAFHAEVGLTEPQSEVGAEGALLHEVMVGKVPPKDLTGEQKRLVSICSDHGLALLLKYVQVQPMYRYECHLMVEAGNVTLSGIIDLAAIAPGVVLILDYKFGRTPVEAAAVNLQIRSYAVMAWAEWFEGSGGPGRVIVAIIQPTVDRDSQVTVAEYGPDEITLAYEQLQDIAANIEAAGKSGKGRYPGPLQCKYCKALGTKRCPESIGIAEGLVKIDSSSLLPTGYPLVDLWEKLKTIEPMIEKLKAHAKAEARAGRMPGWTVSEPKPERSLPDADAAWQRVSEVITPAEFIAICKVGVGDLQEVLAKKLGWKAKDAGKEFNALLGVAVQMKLKDGSLKPDADSPGDHTEPRGVVESIVAGDTAAGERIAQRQLEIHGQEMEVEIIESHLLTEELSEAEPVESGRMPNPGQIAREFLKENAHLFSDADEAGPPVEHVGEVTRYDDKGRPFQELRIVAGPSGMKHYCQRPDGSYDCPAWDQCHHQGACMAKPHYETMQKEKLAQGLEAAAEKRRKK